MRLRASIAFAVAFAVALGSVSCADPTHDNAVDALGGEAPGVRPGPTHRPGQPCLTCHGGSGPGSPDFSVAGTVYSACRQGVAVSGAAIQIEDAVGTRATLFSNQVGNFYTTPDTFTPVYPFQVTVVLGNLKEQMQTHVGRSGSCADCHTDPPNQTSPGVVFISPPQ